MDPKERTKELHQKIRTCVDEGTEAFLSILPTDVAEHLVNSKKEILLAFRSFIDEEIKYVDERTAGARERREGQSSAPKAEKPTAANKGDKT